LGPGHSLDDGRAPLVSSFIRNLLGDLEKIDPVKFNLSQEQTIESQLPLIFEVLHESGQIPSGTSFAYCQHLLRTYQAQTAAVRAYLPKGTYKGRVTLIRSSETVEKSNSMKGLEKDTFGWQTYCEKPITCYDLPRGHFEILEEKWVAELAKLMEVDIKNP